jgi:hypothetical protein
MPSFEVLLPIGAIAFYVYDSAILLYGNELALERAGSGWRTSAGLPLQIAGRRPFVPNPIAPGTLLFRARWDAEPADSKCPEFDTGALRSALASLRGVVTLQVLLLFVVLPPTSILLGAGRLLLVVFVVYYLLTLAGIAVLVVKRRTLRVPGRRIAWLTLESLLCAPFSANLVRKISLARSEELDWRRVAEREFSRETKDQTLRAVDTRITELLAGEEPGSPQSDRLESIRGKLKEHLGVPVVA